MVSVIEGRKTTDEDIVAAVEGRKNGILHLTHNDLDAAGADAIHRMVYGKITTIFASVGRYDSTLALIAGLPGRGDVLSISDLGYKRGVEASAKAAAANGWKIEWRDHHRWTDAEADLVRPHCALLTIDTSVCATGIVAKDLRPGDSAAVEVARVVCDYDLWKKEDPRADVLGLVTQRRHLLPHIRNLLSQGKFTDRKVEEIYAEIRAEMDAAIGASISEAKIYREKYTIAFAPLHGYPSETAHAIRDALGTDIEVIVSKNGRFSIRSVPPVSHLIARKFGGGGHPNAAGGSFTFSLMDRFFFWLLKRNRHFKELVKVAEVI
ncbi:phosphoesterase [Methanofollis aquaemaris]|uniref:Phosphoesterase n=1 Tax=Methanofollis aquaemaris TaxID=126734 RepID=A0A8A3S3Y9_9EURY|nr:phosphoesterase [Methanofollis aquaemaris]QSZ66782.1 phosphoesterase [Methanofollis aquaemaris]